MKEECPSFTALGAARSRAAHLLLDDEPKIFQDHLALGLCGINNEAILRADIEALISKAAIRLGSELAQKVFSYPRAMMAMRSRYTEEALEQTINSGMKQYVILAPGSLRSPTAVWTWWIVCKSLKATTLLLNNGSKGVCVS